MHTSVNSKVHHKEFIDLIWLELGRLGWTPTDLARNCGISQSTISRILNNIQTNLTENTKRAILTSLSARQVERKAKVIKMETKERSYADRLIERLEADNDELKERLRILEARLEGYPLMEEDNESLKKS